MKIPTAANPYAAPEQRMRSLAPSAGLPLPDVQLATPGVRLLARIVDNIVFVGSLSSMFFAEDVATDESSAWLLAVACAILFFGLVFAQAMLIAATGASIGKRLLGIKMIRHDGSEVGFLHGWLIRSVLYGVLEGLGGVFFFVIPQLIDSLMIFSLHGQTLHDRMAGTYVIRVR